MPDSNNNFDWFFENIASDGCVTSGTRRSVPNYVWITVDVSVSEEVFQSVDADNDGKITKEEAAELVKKLNLNIDQEAVEKLFEGEDKQTISFEEFETLLQSEA